jgi:hypothetical protein
MTRLTTSVYFTLFLALSSYGQRLEDGTDISQTQGNYIAFRLLDKAGNGKMQALVDAGQAKGGMGGLKPSPVVDTDGKPMIFFGPVDALNFFFAAGWRYVTDYNIGFQFMLLERIPEVRK